MAILDDIHKSISGMTDEELSETFRQIRLSRRTGANIKKKTKAKSPAVPKVLTPPPVSAISPEMAAQLLAKLGQ